MKKIPLTKGYFAKVDDRDYEELSKYKWIANVAKNTVYAVRHVNVNGKIKTIAMHRQILNCPEGRFTDHRDGNGLNNQRRNIRIVTARQNTQNLHMFMESKFPGVQSCGIGKYFAMIRLNNKNIHLGTFDLELQAFRAYYDVCIELGEPPLDFTYPAYPIMFYDPSLPDKPKRKLTYLEKKYDYNKSFECPIWDNQKIVVWKKVNK